MLDKKKMNLTKILSLRKVSKKLRVSLIINCFLFNKESKENGELYGSIKPKEIANEILKKLKVEIKPSQIVIKNELNKVGTYKILINLHSEVSSNITIKIDKIQSK